MIAAIRSEAPEARPGLGEPRGSPVSLRIPARMPRRTGAVWWQPGSAPRRAQARQSAAATRAWGGASASQRKPWKGIGVMGGRGCSALARRLRFSGWSRSA